VKHWNFWRGISGSLVDAPSLEPTVSAPERAKQRRGGTRVQCEITVTLFSSKDGVCWSGKPCEVILVNPYGCAARFSDPLAVRAAVRLKGLPIGTNVLARVVNCIAIKDRENFWLLGLSLDEPANVWGIESPPEDWKIR
jgi:hypothetical protein